MAASIPQTQHRLFLCVPPGLEPWLVAELAELGIPSKPGAGGVELRASTEQMWQLHRDVRLAEHIRLRLKSFTARHFNVLISELGRLPWHAYLRRQQPFEVQVTCHRSKLWHSDAVAERARAAIESAIGARNSTEESSHDPQIIHVRITGDRVQTSVDASGERLHRRGQRTLVGKAPLRETLAAALVRMAMHYRQGPLDTLWDPFCGSGCILLEWAERQLGLAAGRHRHFAFEQWPIHDERAYSAYLNEPTAPRALTLRGFGSDLHAPTLAAAAANAESLPDVNMAWFGCDFEACLDQIPEGTAIVTNPPYGVRVSDATGYARLMQRFEAMLARRHDLRPVIALLPRPLGQFRPRLPWQTVAEFYNGGLAVQALALT